LEYNSSAENPLIKTILTYPDKTKKQLTLPITINVGQIGLYEIEITANKDITIDSNTRNPLF
jgi:hypothetical protein